VLEGARVRLRPEQKRGGIRLLAVLAPRAAEAYAAAVAPLVPAIEAALSPEVLANRVATVHRSPARIELEPWEVARARFRRLVRERAARAGAALMADVRDCYGSISAELVAASLGALGCRGAEIARVVRVLEGLSACGVRGLPIGPEPSAVLANAVLLAVDRALRDGGWLHLRWVDDVIVFTDGPAAAGEALARFTAAVEGLGLAVATAKTRVIVDPAQIRGAATGSGPAPRGHAAAG
jgi:hypothetical protein